jgi:hypothetical protein
MSESVHATIARLTADRDALRSENVQLTADVRRLSAIEASARAFRESQRPYKLILIAGQREYDDLFALLDAKESE